MWPTFEDIGTGGIQLRVELAEIVMDRRCPEHTHALALALLDLKPLGLYDHAEAFDEEDTTEDGQQQLLVDDDGTDADNTADSQRTRQTRQATP